MMQVNTCVVCLVHRDDFLLVLLLLNIFLAKRKSKSMKITWAFVSSVL